MFEFDLKATDGSARAGTFHTPHGPVETPAFMPVGTQGTVKGVSPDELESVGASMILANTYHLYLRPGQALVHELGGLHAFMRWDGPILTDSGGFQVFSLANMRDIREEGVEFQSHVDGSRHLFTPEGVMEIERTLGADVIMAFDECPPGGVDLNGARDANERTIRWLARCRDRFLALEEEGDYPEQALFPVLQGNIYPELRREGLRQFAELGDWPGLGIGGLSVGEPKQSMWTALEEVDAHAPARAPRYLMGVGYPDDLLESIRRGCDMFDCVAPTRNARHGTAWTEDEGQVNLKAARFARDRRPINPGCDCYACQRFDRAYIRHLLKASELLAYRLIAICNLRFLTRITEEARRRIHDGSFDHWSLEWLLRYRSNRAERNNQERSLT